MPFPKYSPHVKLVLLWSLFILKDHVQGTTSVPSFAMKHSITSTAAGAYSVFAVDVDGDGDVDVLSASQNDDTIAWYENDGSSPPVFTKHNITTDADSSVSVFALDMDHDGDMDVLSASQNDKTIAWYENDGNSPPSFTKHNITTDANGAWSVFAVDVDGDGDVDVLSASSSDIIAWYENDGGSPPSFTMHIIDEEADSARSVFAVDVDGDGDVDVLSASRNDDTIAWYESNRDQLDGSSPPNFTKHIITDTANGAYSVYALDMDHDGDVDVLSASQHDDTIAWYENDGTSTPTFTKHIITTDADGAWSVYAVDVNGDGNVDVLSASSGDNTIAWYENDGNSLPGFTKHIITNNASSARSVFAVDLDGDGEVDVLSASSGDNTIAWYGKIQPSVSPTLSPTVSPTVSPTLSPTASPTVSPTAGPTTSPTESPTSSPTVSPTASPSLRPTKSPTAGPTTSPTVSPTASPTTSPTVSPTASPTTSPTVSPTASPTPNPTASPTILSRDHDSIYKYLRRSFFRSKRNIFGG